ncbi:hypothetical protein LIS77_13030 [Cytobacillus firmus]|uniref:DUF6944 family repetitive protein n=1 Tax=Cytobacillus firmus TaxID=1399 RepID=UPI0018CCDCAE|nr:hypothetical protein [Cytobacillus firmus]MBG9451049.1 hypothetical protein [Cytobacillus firmus]USK36871.1 hypothetical protein LIS77_13030 [Cytobacillus firmus]
MYLEGDDLLTVGAYFLVAGTFISAIGETMKPDVNNVNKKLIRDGNGVQAVGNSLQGFGRISLAEGNETANLYGIIGSFTQAGGNSINTAANNIEIQNPSVSVSGFNSLGSTIQSMGAALEAAGVENDENNLLSNLETLGYSLISVSAILDAIGILIEDEKSIQKRVLLAAGGWFEFIGAVLGAYVIIQAGE